MTNPLNNPCLVSHLPSAPGFPTIATFDNGDRFTVTNMNPADGAMCFVVIDDSVTGPEREFVVTINFDFYGDRTEHESAAEVTGAASHYASINYLDSHYFNQYVADRKANLITTCALHEAANV